MDTIFKLLCPNPRPVLSNGTTLYIIPVYFFFRMLELTFFQRCCFLVLVQCPWVLLFGKSHLKYAPLHAHFTAVALHILCV